MHSDTWVNATRIGLSRQRARELSGGIIQKRISLPMHAIRAKAEMMRPGEIHPS